MSQHDLVALARRLLTPGADLGEFGDDRHSTDWLTARIAWHRLDGNNELADEMLKTENKIREALGQDPIDA